MQLDSKGFKTNNIIFFVLNARSKWHLVWTVFYSVLNKHYFTIDILSENYAPPGFMKINDHRTKDDGISVICLGSSWLNIARN